MKNRFVAIFIFTAFVLMISCNIGNRHELNQDDLTVDHFEVDVLIPNDDVKKAVEKSTYNLINSHTIDSNDTIRIRIECDAIWEPSNNANPLSIKIAEVDTSWFYLTINEGLRTETTMNWRNPSDRALLHAIKTILDTSTYSLQCVNCDDITPQSILDTYVGPFAETRIDFKMCIGNNNIPVLPDLQSGAKSTK